ncbi:hypothetical protein CALVIDRAFT_596121 [Calocera viscosa TUFC12733]|uniref:DUF7918 domain-containing protein n=1 Tax=Calocera viscosa (strain TUFC12733) TaxID=1330018 RepID=A0A167Q926_CALVF|nr:hypothetical protein CALVIDRAFT_596121 [Calocera viscosa TUFC12733]
MKLGNYSAVIASNDTRLEEYQVEESHGGRMVTCWVASNEGQRFGVNCNLGNGTDTLRIRLLADGVLLDKRIADHMHHCCLSGNRLSSREKRPFEFARGVVPIEEFDVEDEDEEDEDAGQQRRQARDKEMWSERGTITVEFYRVRVEYGRLPPPEEHKYYASSSAGLHTIKVGRTELSHRMKLRNITVVEALSPADEQPFVTFKFKHRPQSWLEMYKIITPDELDKLAALALSGDAEEGEGEGSGGEGRKRRRSPTPVYVKKLARLGMGERAEEGDADGEDERLEDVPAGASEEERMEDPPPKALEEQPMLDDDAESSAGSTSRLSAKADAGSPQHRTPPPRPAIPGERHPTKGDMQELERHMLAAARARAAAGLDEEDTVLDGFLMHHDGGDEDSGSGGRDADGRSPSKRRRSEPLRETASAPAGTTIFDVPSGKPLFHAPASKTEPLFDPKAEEPQAAPPNGKAQAFVPLLVPKDEPPAFDLTALLAPDQKPPLGFAPALHGVPNGGMIHREARRDDAMDSDED